MGVVVDAEVDVDGFVWLLLSRNDAVLELVLVSAVSNIWIFETHEHSSNQFKRKGSAFEILRNNPDGLV